MRLSRVTTLLAGVLALLVVAAPARAVERGVEDMLLQRVDLIRMALVDDSRHCGDAFAGVCDVGGFVVEIEQAFNAGADPLVLMHQLTYAQEELRLVEFRTDELFTLVRAREDALVQLRGRGEFIGSRAVMEAVDRTIPLVRQIGTDLAEIQSRITHVDAAIHRLEVLIRGG